MKALIVCKDSNGGKETETCKLIKKEGFEIVYAWKNTLSKKHLEDVDLVISIGGDGTALSASHYLEEKPLLAVNSDPNKSEGALTTLSVGELEEKLEEVKKGFEIEYLERIEVYINGKRQDFLALNDVFIANEKAYLISKYKLSFNGEQEEQMSSGIIFSTGTGSTAWFKSAGGTPFSAQSKFIKMIVREPYHGRNMKFSLVQETIREKDDVEIEILSDSVLAIDSIREFKLKKGDKVKIKISDKPLKRIV
jgi:NAD kinase